MLNLQQAANYLGVSEQKINRWLGQGVIPSRMKAGEPHFSKAELTSWAGRVNLPLKDPSQDRDLAGNTLQAALRRGGIHRDLVGSNQEEILSTAVAALSLPEGVDAKLVLKLLLEREQVLSTGMGAGVAIPHPQNPLKLGLKLPVLACCFAKDPVDYKARDGQPVYCLFILLSCDPVSHLKLLSGLAKHLKQEAFKSLLVGNPDDDALIAGFQE